MTQEEKRRIVEMRAAGCSYIRISAELDMSVNSIEFDCEAVMRDGTIIRYDVYRPDREGQYPCITTYGPYSKGMHFS